MDSGNIVSTRQKGFDGEDKACAYLIANGYEIIDRNYYTRFGEIDIIARKDKFLVFVEVKSLPHGDIDTLSYVLNKKKQQKIIKTSKCYLLNHRQYNYEYIRYDVLAIDVPVLDPVYHIENDFSE